MTILPANPVTGFLTGFISFIILLYASLLGIAISVRKLVRVVLAKSSNKNKRKIKELKIKRFKDS